MLPKLTFLAALLLMAAFVVATHCPEYPACGHAAGAACPGACVNLPPGIIGGGQYCYGVEPGVGGGGPSGGGGPAATATPEPTPDILWFQEVGGSYSYNDDCGDWIDPITVVVRRNGAAIVEHVSHHGVADSTPTPEPLDADATSEFWGLHEGRQHYLDGNVCVWGVVSQAANDGWHWCGVAPFEYPCAESRWHTRCNIVGSYHDPYGGAATWSVCTPHWDQADGTLPCWHWVPRVFGDRWDGPGGIPEDNSGFTAGREYLYQLLVAVGGHRFMGSYLYGNDQEMHQCNDDPNQYGGQGDWTPSDGLVYFIEVLP